MKQIAVLMSLLLLSCSGSIETKTAHTPTEPMQLGWMQREDFVRPEYPKFKENYDTVHVSDSFINMIRSLQDDAEFIVVLGTWCGDSKREVPRFLKIADLAGIPVQHTKFYGVDRTKKSNDGVTAHYAIDRVPTFIVLRHGEEVGRIVEAPKNTLEEDILAILADSQGK